MFSCEFCEIFKITFFLKHPWCLLLDIWLHSYYILIEPDVIEINDLRVPLDKVLILDRYLLLEAELQWFYNKQEIQLYNKI